MSRSRRKTPIFGITSARSEADDKREWHKRWRSRQRDQINSLGPDDDPLLVQRYAVSSAWLMSKDGKSWFAPHEQREMADAISQYKAKNKTEQEAIRKRLLAKWRSK